MSYSIVIDHLDLEQIAKSGQCFRWKKLGEYHFSVVAFGHFLEMRQNQNNFIFSCTEKEWKDIWYSYFDMDTDYEAIGRLIETSKDEHLKEAYANGSGIRILRQDLWEIIVSFLISQNNNIKRITNSVDKLCKTAGLLCDTKEDYRFPLPGEVDDAVWDDSSLGLGYRNGYLREIYAYAKENPDWLKELREQDYESAYENLLLRKGIGKKVANCICLFGLHHVDAFPIDTHVRQLLEKYYPDGFDFKRYDGIAGIIQQYLFYAELTNK